jgi:hypothetical protein
MGHEAWALELVTMMMMMMMTFDIVWKNYRKTTKNIGQDTRLSEFET